MGFYHRLIGVSLTMALSSAYDVAYKRLPEQLEARYPHLNFANHCYLRIALDNTFNAKWDTQINRPAHLNLSERQLGQVTTFLKRYLEDPKILWQHHKKSIAIRKAWKKKNQLSIL